MTPKLLRCIGSLRRRTLIGRSAAWASCTKKAVALLKTSLKLCGCTSLLPPKDFLQHCSMSLTVTSSVEAFVKTRPQPFAGTGAHKQRVTLVLQMLCTGCARDDPPSPTIKPLPPPPLPVAAAAHCSHVPIALRVYLPPRNVFIHPRAAPAAAAAKCGANMKLLAHAMNTMAPSLTLMLPNEQPASAASRITRQQRSHQHHISAGP